MVSRAAGRHTPNMRDEITHHGRERPRPLSLLDTVGGQGAAPVPLVVQPPQYLVVSANAVGNTLTPVFSAPEQSLSASRRGAWDEALPGLPYRLGRTGSTTSTGTVLVFIY